MPLPPNSHLGNYEILESLGAGGMGEVYRARDTRLGRVVAIKVILEAYASDPERAARFQREAKMLAALNHPRIAGLYGLEQADGVHFLVMELVEGETLADRLRRGAMPVEESIGIGLQIAEALEAAHEKGVVHRDLKPANIKITPDHQVKVLDFGLAKAVESDAAVEAANSPTLSMMATQAGVILGTAAYMSPEQAKGFAVDHRSDVFSFGTVLFEMLTGRQPFQGDTAADVLASVLVREPEVSGLPADTNPRLIELVTRCMQKSPKRRWQHIGDVRAELESLAASPRSALSTVFVAPVPRPLWKRALVPAACAIAAASMAGFSVWALRPEPDRAVVSFAHILPDDQTFSNAGRNLIAISPDGRTIVYVADRRLYRRALHELEAVPIPGIENAPQGVTSPAFSPDGQSIVFYSGREQALKRIPLAGGTPFTLCEAQNPTGVDWSEAGIVYAQPTADITRVAATGGKPEILARLQPGERAQMPQLLPGGILIYSVASGLDSERWDKAKVVALSLKSGVRKTLVEAGSAGRYLASGHLVYAVGNTLFAQKLDLTTLDVRGEPMPVLEGVARSNAAQSGVTQLAVSANGTLAYVPGSTAALTREFEMVTANRAGVVTALAAPSAGYDAPRVSRDGRRIVVESNDGKQYAVLVYDVSGTAPPRRVTVDGNNRSPIWSADGTRVTFTSDRQGDAGLFWQAADGASVAERLTRPSSGERHIAESWSPDGETLLFDVLTSDRHSLWTLSMRDRKTAPLAGLEARTPMRASFSRDGKWIVYAIPRDGQMTVQVQPFPATGAKHELLVQGTDRAHDAVWSPDGRGLYYIAGPGRIWFVPVTTAPAFAFGNATHFPRAFPTAGPSIRGQYDVAPGDKFVATRRVDAATAALPPGAPRPFQQIRVVVNWMATLDARQP